MHSQKKFKQMVVFVEACESGSMFVNLSSTDSGKCIKLHGNSGWSRSRTGDETERLQCVFGSVVYAVTAANPHESSWACYYDEKLETYLGDVFSVNWMENVDSVRNLIPLYASMQLFKMSI